MQQPPGGLVEGHRLPKRLRVNGGGAWYLAANGLFERVGEGDLSLADLRAVEGDLGGRVFVSLPVARSLEPYLGGRDNFFSRYVQRRVQRYEGMRDRVQPTVRAVARDAQVAVVPGGGIFWVDGHGLFKPGETVPLPWTEPLVEMVVIRPSGLVREMRAVIGKGGPRRVPTPHE